MQTRYDVSMDKQSLSAIDPAIYILDIAHNEPRRLESAEDIAGRHGQTITQNRIQSSSVTITFEIHNADIRKRQRICERAAAWAMGGRILRTNDRPGQFLRAVCSSPPVIGSALRWTQAIKMTFTAYDPPFWQEEDVQTAQITGKSGTSKVYAPGNAPMALVEATVKNVSSQTMGHLKITAGDTYFQMEGLGLAPGKELNIYYDENMMLHIETGGESRMKMRTARSSDDLMIPCGKTSEVSIEAYVDVSATISVRGLWL